MQKRNSIKEKHSANVKTENVTETDKCFGLERAS